MPEQPDLILTPFGENAPSGAIDTIPEQRSPGDPLQRASWQDGFPTVTMQPLASGGIPPRGQDFNGVLNAISQHLAYLGAGGVYRWDDEVVARGGYSQGAVLQSDDGTATYVSAIDGNTVNFNTTPSAIGNQWIPAGGASKANSSLTISAGAGLGGGGNLSANRTLFVDFASEEQAQELLISNKVISPLNLGQALGHFGQFQPYSATRTYTTGDIVRGSDGQFYEFYDRDSDGTVQGEDPTNAANRPHVWMRWDGNRPGQTIEWRSETLPEGYVENDGAEISRADYRRVFSAFGTTYGAGDGSTTFLLPDDRGEFKRGWDNGRGVDPGRALSAHQLDQMQLLVGTAFFSNSALSRTASNYTGVYSSADESNTRNTSGTAVGADTLVFNSANSPDARVSSTTSGETRSRNNAVIWLTKI